ncbi:MAG: dienelactone hydrolase family protein [Planctomycetota bacterium]
MDKAAKSPLCPLCPLWLLFLVVGVVSAAEEKAPADSRRRLPVADLQRWYDKELDLKGDEDLARRVQEAERLMDDLFEAPAPARAKVLERVLALALPPAALRAVARCGHVPQAEPQETKAGYVQGQATVPGFPKEQIPVTARIPQGYTHARLWPLIVDLHGSHGNGSDYIKLWEDGAKPAALDQFLIVAPTSHGPHGWGPSLFGRALVLAALRWAERQYRVDAERVYLSGCSMGGIGVKTFAVNYPDYFAAAVSRSGAPLRETDTPLFRNLHALPLWALAGDQDEMIPAALLKKEQEVIAQAHIPARVEILPGRGHEAFQERNGEILDFFLKQSRQRCPAKLDFVSVEDAPVQRQYWVEATRFLTAGNAPISKFVMDNERFNDPVMQKMQAAKTLPEHLALVQEALRAGVILEERRAWTLPREAVLSVDRAANTITVELARFVGELRILLDDDLLDLDRPVIVKQGAVQLAQRQIVRSPRFLLDEALRTGRRDMTFWGQVTVTPRN